MINEYLSEMEALNRSQKTIDSVRYTLQKLEKFKKLEEMTKNDLIIFFKNLDCSESSKRLYLGIIKKFYKQYGKDDIVNWIRLPALKEKRMEVLTVEDIQKLIDTTINPYHKAYISFAFETGARFGEIQALRWKDLSEDCTIANIMTEKTAAGLRRIPLKISSSYLMNLKLQINATENDIIFPLSECRTNGILKEIAQNADISKKVHPHAFRHACATYLVEKGTQEALIRKWCGWTPTSTMISKYQHLSDDILVRNSGNKKEISELKQADSVLDNLRIENHTLKEDIDQLKVEIEELKKFQIEFFKQIKHKYTQK